MFRGQLFAGRLFSGKLFGGEEVTPQTEIPLMYHGGGTSREEDVVALVLDKWRSIEAARARREERSRNARRISVEIDGPIQIVPDGLADEPDAVPSSIKTGPSLPVIQTMFSPQQRPERVAPTRSKAATVQAQLDDGMEELMTLLIALEEAGEL